MSSMSRTRVAAWANRNAGVDEKYEVWGSASDAMPVVCTPAAARAAATPYATAGVATLVGAAAVVVGVGAAVATQQHGFSPHAVTVVSRAARPGEAFDALLLAASAA